jgi:hypothetical protein
MIDDCVFIGPFYEIHYFPDSSTAFSKTTGRDCSAADKILSLNHPLAFLSLANSKMTELSRFPSAPETIR